MACISSWQRGQLPDDRFPLSRAAAAAPQRGQCLLPMNIMPKHEAQAIVASREPQYLQSGSSVDVAAPHIGQLSVSAFIGSILTVDVKLDYKWRLCDSCRDLKSC
jgi:hypothetical protein